MLLPPQPLRCLDLLSRCSPSLPPRLAPPSQPLVHVLCVVVRVICCTGKPGCARVLYVFGAGVRACECVCVHECEGVRGGYYGPAYSC